MNGSPMLLGIRSRSRSGTDFWTGDWVAAARLAQRSPEPGPDQVRQRQADEHGDERVDQVEHHHEGAEPPLDLVGDDRAQDREDDQRGRQRREGAEDQVRRAVQAGCALAPGQSDGDRHHDRDDDPDIERDAARPALGLLLDRSALLGLAGANAFSDVVIACSTGYWKDRGLVGPWPCALK